MHMPDLTLMIIAAEGDRRSKEQSGAMLVRHYYQGSLSEMIKALK